MVMGTKKNLRNEIVNMGLRVLSGASVTSGAKVLFGANISVVLHIVQNIPLLYMITLKQLQLSK